MEPPGTPGKPSSWGYVSLKVLDATRSIRCIIILAFVEAKMDFLLNANVAYVLLVLGVVLALMALTAPGTGLLELGALFALLLAGYGAYHLELNGWAFIPLVLAVAPFLLALRSKGVFRAGLLAAAILLVSAGSMFLFRGADGGWMGVHPLLAGLVSILAGGILWLMVERSLVAMSVQPAHNADALVGQVGEARTEVHTEGSVQVGGELWSARSEAPIAAGSPVRVVRRDGFMLIVEAVSK
jgi:membrane-bound serine protease (ClpP class)